MPVYERLKMCKECPFRADAVRGWLGPFTVEDMMKFVHGPAEVAPGVYLGDVGLMYCHTDTDRLTEAGVEEPELSEQNQVCVGLARYANAMLKDARDRTMSDFQMRVAAAEDSPVIPRGKLREYHTVTPVKGATCSSG